MPTILTVAGIVVAYIVFTEIWTRKLWFDSVNFEQVFTTQLGVQVLLFAIFFLLMGLIVGGNMWLAYRLRPVMRRSGQSAVLDRYRDLLEANIAVAILVPSGFMALMAGASAVSQSMQFIAWWNRTPFGTTDPYFGLDVSFYVFEYPIYAELISFALGAVFFALLGAAVVHFTVGGIGFGRASSGVGRAARIHLSTLFALLLVLYGVNQLLGRYGLLLSNGTLFTGMQYTDYHSRLTAKLVIAVIAFICAALFVANGFIHRAMVPAAGLALMLVSALILGLIYPSIVQGFQVRPNEPDKERPFIAAHIAATRQAFNIADTEVEEYDAVTKVSAGQLKEDAETLPGIRLIDPAVVSSTFDQQQQVRGYYSFPDALDVDRYVINGVETDAVVAARELDLSKLPDQNWNNLHTVYTHGYGLVAAYGNRRSSSGDPVWIDGDLPPSGKLGSYEGRIYYGENSSTFAIVGREAGQQSIELDTPAGGKSGAESYNTYSGSGGVSIGNWFNRLLYATHFMDLNILLSDRVNSASKLLYERTPKERVAEVAPWLTLDSNVYPAIVNKRLVWIVDGYTTSSTYPNSELESLRDSTSDAQSSLVGSQVDTQVNYLRNSVKAVVDATDGTVNLYAWDTSDPILQTYMKAFPGTVQPKSAISAELKAHLRYPEDMFKVQRQVLTRYHMTDPAAWYQKSDLWQVPTDPTTSTSGKASQTGAAEPPYYLSIKWPGDKSAVFSETAVFVPNGRSNLTAYLSVVAEATSSDYGKLRVLKMSGTRQVDGPGQTFNAMTSDQKFASLLLSYTNQGSAAAKYGNLLTLPMGSGLLYVMPIYTSRQGSTGSYPALRFVAARFGETVGIGNTLQEALNLVFAGDAGADTGEGDTGSSSGSGSGSGSSTGGKSTTTTTTADEQAAASAMKSAEAAFTAADKALTSGDLAEYQRQVKIAKAAVAEALKKLGR